MDRPKDIPMIKFDLPPDETLMPVERCACKDPLHRNYDTICNLCNNTGWIVKDPDMDED